MFRTGRSGTLDIAQDYPIIGRIIGVALHTLPDAPHALRKGD